MDKYTPKQRSALMAKVKGKNTGPEKTVRSLVHSLGYRFRLHRRDLPGTPDLAMMSRKLAIFVNGCFWHQHPGCRKAQLPSSRRDFWKAKLEANVIRDRDAITQLEALGWRVLVLWECEIRDRVLLESVLKEFLGSK